MRLILSIAADLMRLAQSRAVDGPDCTVGTDGSVHEPVHASPWRSPDASYRTLPPSADHGMPASGGMWPPKESKTPLTAEPLDLHYKNEIIRRVHQERDQARAVGPEMQ